MSAENKFVQFIVLSVVILNSVNCFKNLDYNGNSGILLNKIIKTPWNQENLAADDIRCYCDLPICIATGYMCRTSRSTFEADDATGFKNGGCFMEMINVNDSHVIRRHGCVELFDREIQTQCDNVPRKHTARNVSGEILFLCCQNDMCNHVDNPDIVKKIPKLNATNGSNTLNNLISNNPPAFPDSSVNVDDVLTTKTGIKSSQLSSLSGVYQAVPSTYNDVSNELWFKMATITVPILGAIILFLLVACAIRMLKTEDADISGNVHSSGSYNQYTKNSIEPGHSPLLVKENQIRNMTECQIKIHKSCDNKNEVLAKRNDLINLEYSLLPESCNDPNVKLTNTEEGVVNNIYSKNFNFKTLQPTSLPSFGSSTASGPNQSYYPGDKCYEKEVLNPVVVNWKK